METIVAMSDCTQGMQVLETSSVVQELLILWKKNLQ